MELLYECKVYFSSWSVVIAGFVLITISFGWIGFVGLWLGLGLAAALMNLPWLFSRGDALMLTLMGPLGFTTTTSDSFDRSAA